LTSSSIGLVIDTQKPSKPNAPDLLASDDNGFEATDNYTNVAQPSFDLTGLSNTLDSLRILVDDGINKAAVMSQATRDTFQLGSALTGGTYNITLVAIDSAGNVSATSDALSITIDLTDPDPPTGIRFKKLPVIQEHQTQTI